MQVLTLENFIAIIHSINRMKERNHMIILVVREKSIDSI